MDNRAYIKSLKREARLNENLAAQAKMQGVRDERNAFKERMSMMAEDTRGLRKPMPTPSKNGMVKGSKDAKDHMAFLRSLKGK
jgi:hypothetical protein